MKRLWAPWRLEYIIASKKESALSTKQKDEGCVFCAASKAKVSADSLVLKQGKTCFLIMNKYPYTNGHLMVIPHRHLADFTKLKKSEHTEMGEMLSLAMKLLKKVYHCESFNVGMNLGLHAGAGIEEHLHYHVVPRWPGDHNFMPVVGNLRVMMEHTQKTFKKLQAGLKSLA